MITHKSEFIIPVNQDIFKLGYSVQYRKAENLQLQFVFPDTIKFSGNDFRYNLFAVFKSKTIKLQAEFLNADFDGNNAYGYYFLSAFNFHKNQIVLSFEDYKDLIDITSNNPYWRIGYNYFIKDYKIKLSLDNYFQISTDKVERYFTTIQLQLFIN